MQDLRIFLCSGFIAVINQSNLSNMYIFQGNNITHLNSKAFGVLPVVFYLDLSQNNITQVESQSFDGLLQLQLLNLTNNYLSTIPTGTFKGKLI